MYVGNQKLASSGIEWVVYLGVATLDGNVAGEEGQENRVVVDINEGELMMFDKRVFK